LVAQVTRRQPLKIQIVGVSSAIYFYLTSWARASSKKLAPSIELSSVAVVGLVVVLAAVELALVEALGVALDVVGAGLVGLVGSTGPLLVASGVVTGKVAAAVVLLVEVVLGAVVVLSSSTL